MNKPLFRIVLGALTLPLACSGDVVSPPQVSSPRQIDAAKMQREVEEAESNFLRGIQFSEGDGVAKDYSAAAQFYRKAADAGYAPAQYNLAHSYENGLGVERDLSQAAAWYRKAAEQGDPEAQNNLGTLYASGQGVPRSDAEAVRWYRLAADQSDPEGTTNLGMMYLQGRAVKRDFAQAFELFSKAAGQDYPVAQNNLALMYANGEGVARDYQWAYAWMDVAAAQIPRCAELRDKVGKEMTAGEIAKAREFAARKREEIAQKGKESK
jgi:TPR repeat protein